MAMTGTTTCDTLEMRRTPPKMTRATRIATAMPIPTCRPVVFSPTELDTASTIELVCTALNTNP